MTIIRSAISSAVQSAVYSSSGRVASSNTLLMDDFSGTGAMVGKTPNITQGDTWNKYTTTFADGSESSGSWKSSATGLAANGCDIGQTDCAAWFRNCLSAGVTANDNFGITLSDGDYSASYANSLQIYMRGDTSNRIVEIYEIISGTAFLKNTPPNFPTPTSWSDFDWFGTFAVGGDGKVTVTAYDENRSAISGASWTQTAVNAASTGTDAGMRGRGTASNTIGAVAFFDSSDISTMPTSFPT